MFSCFAMISHISVCLLDAERKNIQTGAMISGSAIADHSSVST